MERARLRAEGCETSKKKKRHQLLQEEHLGGKESEQCRVQLLFEISAHMHRHTLAPTHQLLFGAAAKWSVSFKVGAFKWRPVSLG